MDPLESVGTIIAVEVAGDSFSDVSSHTGGIREIYVPIL